MMLLDIQGLKLSITDDQGQPRPLLDGVDLQVRAGEVVGLVGESGCGKSLTALSILQLLPRPQARIDGGRILFQGQDLVPLSGDQLARLRGGQISMIFQDAMAALNPVQRVGRQLLEVLALHRPGQSPQQRHQRAVELLTRVGLPDPAERMQAWPHQLSGGQRQRVMIAMALACEPALLIADEPTTALDVTIQAQVLDLIRELQQQSGMAVLFITHDLGVVAQLCQQVAVMYAGQIVERAAASALFARPHHPYSRALLGALPRLDAPTQVDLPSLSGQVPEPGHFPPGCRFANRCPEVRERCHQEVPELSPIDGSSTASVACLRWRELDHD